jgi:hypothetical protein
MFIGVGDGGTILTSYNGRSWMPQNSQTVSDLSGIAYGAFVLTSPSGFLLVAVGNHVITISPDGTNWTAFPSSAYLADVAYASTQFVGVTRQSSPDDPNVLLSQNGTNWTTRRFTTNAFGDPAWFASVAYGAGTIVAVADISNGIWTSRDGAAWTHRSAENEDYLGVAFGNGRFVAIGQEGAPNVSTSAGIITGSPWQSFPVDPNGGYFSDENYHVGKGIAFGDGRFVVFRGGRTNIFTSMNGSNWVIRPFPAAGMMAGAYGNGTFVAVGPSGVFQSDSFAPNLTIEHLSTNQPLGVSFLAETGRSYRIEVSTNLLQWTEVLHLTNTQTSVRYIDWSVTNSPRLFYRALAP